MTTIEDPSTVPLDRLFAELQRGVAADRGRSFAERARLCRACSRRIGPAAAAWVASACRQKGIEPQSAMAADEWANGPLPVARHLRCLHATMRDLARGRLPALPAGRGEDGLRVPVVPRGWFDRLALPGYRAAVRLAPGPLQQEPPGGGQGVQVVLGAGNVSSMPIGDALHAIFLRGAAVLLKLSPLHADLQALFASVLAPLVDADLLRICAGDGALGAAAVRHPATVAWHLTGARATLRSLLADPLAAALPWTAELGGVTPVVVMPGVWRTADLRTAARHLAAWFQSNAACNCITPRLLLCCADWPQRAAFLQCLREQVGQLAARMPFHPGARARFARFAGDNAPPGPLPFALRTGVDLDREPHLAAEESFAPVLVEVALGADTPARFAAAAAALLRDRTTGALAAHLIAPPRVLGKARSALRTLIDALPHGTVAINTWAAIGYGMMTTPWGAGLGTGGDFDGRGFTHNTLCLRAPQQTVVTAPFRPWPAPPWMQEPDPTALLMALTDLHSNPGPVSLLRTALRAALRGRLR